MVQAFESYIKRFKFNAKWYDQKNGSQFIWEYDKTAWQFRIFGFRVS